MRRRLLDLLACPRCQGALSLDIAEELAGEIQTGTLSCGCGASFPIRAGIPRFVDDDTDYCKNFGYQWKRWKNLQIDRLGAHTTSERRFFAEVPWDREWMKGKLILDCGCGAGRFTDVAALHGAEIVACDISAAIDACRETTAIHGEHVHHVQASIYDLPFRRGTFDAVYCLGVIQHTPDPARTMRSMPPFLKPGGRLAYDFYESKGWSRLGQIKYMLRKFTPNLSPDANLTLSRALVAALFPIGSVLRRVPLGSIPVAMMPIAMHHDPELTLSQEYAWTLLDTFDWYGPKYELRQDHREVVKLLEQLGLQDVRGRKGVVTARACAA